PDIPIDIGIGGVQLSHQANLTGHRHICGFPGTILPYDAGESACFIVLERGTGGTHDCRDP
ncbi:MAG TPA: hypothetical protein VGI22_28955, partial [Xanthobacteraceae bacterium]